MLRVSDRAGSESVSRLRRLQSRLPLSSTASAPRSGHRLRDGGSISRLHTWPARTPVNASPAPLRTTMHDSGSVWVATPSLYETFIHNTLPALTGALNFELLNRSGCTVRRERTSDQLLRSGTSVGAHFREAQRAKSNLDFISKLEGGMQELEETAYWLELLEGARFCGPCLKRAARAGFYSPIRWTIPKCYYRFDVLRILKRGKFVKNR